MGGWWADIWRSCDQISVLPLQEQISGVRSARYLPLQSPDTLPRTGEISVPSSSTRYLVPVLGSYLVADGDECQISGAPGTR
jgi:hypothetical protein